MKVGDLIVSSFARDTKIFYQVIREPYTTRFMTSEDWEMAEHGLGDLAGIYADAIDILVLSGDEAGRTFKKRKAANYKLFKKDS